MLVIKESENDGAAGPSSIIYEGTKSKGREWRREEERERDLSVCPSTHTPDCDNNHQRSIRLHDEETEKGISSNNM